MADRDLILASLPDGSGGRLAEPYLRTIGIGELWTVFEERLTALGGKLIPRDALPLMLTYQSYWADGDSERFVPRSATRAESVWDAEVGICLADLAIAETGTLVVAAKESRYRLTSLAPPVNVILVRERDIVASVEEAFAKLPAETTVLITGTSRTADIEGVMVRGVHGPGELYVMIV